MVDIPTPKTARPTTIAGALLLSVLSALGWVGQQFVAAQESVARVEVAIDAAAKQISAIDHLVTMQNDRILTIERAVTGGAKWPQP